VRQGETVYLGQVPVGDGHPTVFMAELGTFFNQDVALAKTLIEAAARAGVAVVKSEILHTPDICLPRTGLEHAYVHAGGSATEDYRALMERKVIPLEVYQELYVYCQSLGLPFVASVYDVEGVDFLKEAGAAGLKISRDKIDNVALIRYAAATGLPVIIDAGEVMLEEVAQAVGWAREAGCDSLILNHHPGSEPAPAAAHNLRVIETYKRLFGLPVGFSCHFQGEDMLYVAVGAGANLLEKGVADSPERKEQAIIAASPAERLPEITAKVRQAWEALGSGRPQLAETKKHPSRQCLVAKVDIARGQVLGLNNLQFAFPPMGISVRHWDLVAGRRAARPLAKGHVLVWEDLAPEGAGLD
jgi:sialic acid synthase SpsE